MRRREWGRSLRKVERKRMRNEELKNEEDRREGKYGGRGGAESVPGA